MLAENMEVWHGLVIAVVSIFLQTCLLTAINYLLSRHTAKENERLLKAAKLPAPPLSPDHHHPPAAKEMKGTLAERRTPVSDLHDRHDSDTSSDSSDSSDSSPSTYQAPKDINYAQVDFSVPRDLKNEFALDYENLKEGTDYVNVNPKGQKTNFWAFVNPAASQPVEYTQVNV
ncbi:regulator of hemoglobinization and erythroid cell expansion protein [Elephas maximus indicus]|uniref:regulator of hemoglobinization and erythroid cell expansion protein n=1 Tax=Elephas maximus indicus TaxID=99487 RepID=UPI0021170DFD|nr:regulator of hemoglobinization and erythroid cell expansion protein [Elephas maximus indicus]XP_049714248.1 regulator of hemoglobinization and erythroid cell expansion protein [Elephas maximus indicus]XP_049714249.1 regulator of hemoglobinization and erythroid cell expansion protein [Elephas maximus indicus]XP_049714250.1 regulator of hemoglobinization and erythroid cell expansion protein [Elephas maximus indicus]XP_049714251.1 regulator of hemoglobinization and erythroid cell expansion prot